MRALLQRKVTDYAERCPEATALVLNEERMTYGRLEESTNQLARMLKAAGCVKGDRICLLMSKSPAAIVGLLGILKADCVYVPLDPSSPAPRLAHMIACCEPRWILAAGPVAPLLDELMIEPGFRATISIGWMDPERMAGEYFQSEFSQGDLQHHSGRPLDYQNTLDDAMYILFTSGSTGTPKGVVVTHASVKHFIDWAAGYFGIRASDRISGHPPLHFDLSVFDIFGSLAAGAQLHLVPAELNLLPHQLAEFIRASEITQWFSVPSTLNYLAKFHAVRANDFPALKRLLWCGEVFPTPALRYWMRQLPHVAFTNLYGPTEATIASSYHTVAKCPEDDHAEIPIGAACPGEELLVVDETLHPVAQGEIGHLYIRGAGLSPGYWKDPEKTREAFLQNPLSSDPADRIYNTGDLAKIGSDGLVYFVGRADSQIKSRGYRIELGEIETALNAIDGLRECAVVAVNTGGFEGTTICCAFVPVPGTAMTPNALRTRLSRVLPSYMIPSRWKAFDKLPQNANGKIGRRQLQEYFQTNEPRD